MDSTTLLVLVAAAAAAVLLYFLFRNGKNLVVYEDLNGAEILIDDEFRIKGKPDQVLKN
ncbi:hypothetical protein [Jeotgalibacillus proteolyticus]|uniref:hypothetical protein n=1 Tax=Jeotgalibacillus proteolyticus TaxID=2082395 RepID=UPI00142F7B6B|nr:hypothetical protein [Jeotgalibacillus proteolyticus]